MTRKDIFAVACYLHAIGQKEAGLKLLRQQKAKLSIQKDKERFQKILDSMGGNQVAYANAALPHFEIIDMINKELA